jgi:hypothetical protein
MRNKANRRHDRREEERPGCGVGRKKGERGLEGERGREEEGGWRIGGRMGKEGRQRKEGREHN